MKEPLSRNEMENISVELDVLDDLIVEAKIKQGSLVMACAELIVEQPFIHEREEVDKAKEILRQFSRKDWINRISAAFIHKVME